MLRRSIPIQAAIYKRMLVTRASAISTQQYDDLKKQVDEVHQACQTLVDQKTQENIEHTLKVQAKLRRDERAQHFDEKAVIFLGGVLGLGLLTCMVMVIKC